MTKPASKELQSLYKLVTNLADDEDTEVTCYLEFDPGEKDSRDCPGYPMSINLCYVLNAAGDDICGVLDKFEIERLETAALDHMAWEELESRLP